jgi:hypothetical protein
MNSGLMKSGGSILVAPLGTADILEHRNGLGAGGHKLGTQMQKEVTILYRKIDVYIDG